MPNLPEQAPESSRRSVTLRRVAEQCFEATNARGGTVRMGTGQPGETDFTPVELLLAAIAGCSAVDVDTLTTRRAEPVSFDVISSAEKVRDDTGNHLKDIEVTFTVRFPDGEAGDRAREVYPDAVERSHDRLCTVSRTVERGTAVTMTAD